MDESSELDAMQPAPNEHPLTHGAEGQVAWDTIRLTLEFFAAEDRQAAELRLWLMRGGPDVIS